MMPDGTVALSVLLLSAGAAALVLSYLAGRTSVRGGGRRAGTLAVMGTGCLVAMVVLVYSHGWASLRGEVLWPLSVHLLGALAGLGLGAFTVYSLVAAR